MIALYVLLHTSIILNYGQYEFSLWGNISLREFREHHLCFGPWRSLWWSGGISIHWFPFLFARGILYEDWRLPVHRPLAVSSVSGQRLAQLTVTGSEITDWIRRPRRVTRSSHAASSRNGAFIAFFPQQMCQGLPDNGLGSSPSRPPMSAQLERRRTSFWDSSCPANVKRTLSETRPRTARSRLIFAELIAMEDVWW